MPADHHVPCENPLWPCAMTGAAACLAGFEDLAVVIHGSSGCYFYPSSIIATPIHGTFLIENEVIFGTESRLREVIEELEGRYARIAVVNTCVPAIMGEELEGLAQEGRIFIVDSPGFLGNLEVGYHKALAEVAPAVDCDATGINIDGICCVDPFCRGNALEARRLLSMAGASVATTFCLDTYAATRCSAPLTVGTNPDLASGVGRWCGSLLGLEAITETIDLLAAEVAGIDVRPVKKEIEWADTRIRKACSKYIRRFDPPRVAIFSGRSYTDLAAGMLKKYLDADIAYIAARDDPDPRTTDFSAIGDTIRDTEPDLILGSSYEQTLAGDAAFVGMTLPIRDKVLLHSRAVAGVEGALWLMDEILNACINQNRRNRSTSAIVL